MAGTALTLAATVPLAWLFWQARVLNHALSHDAGALSAPGSWIAWLAILILGLTTIGSLLGTWRSRDRNGADDIDAGSPYAKAER